MIFMENSVKRNLEDKGSLSLAELAVFLEAKLKGDPELKVFGIGGLDTAIEGEVSFLVDARYKHLLTGCRASALIVSPKFEELESNLLIVENPYLALARAAKLFCPPVENESAVHPTAFVGEAVFLGEGVCVGALAHVGEGSTVGSQTTIGASAYVGRNVTIGQGCLIHPRATILDGCILGDRVIVHAGAVIGADGYGYASEEGGKHLKIPQIGIVQIDDDVEIGANTTVDRATFGKTWIKRGVKIDNLVMIAHNVVVGEDTLIVAQAGIAGSTRLGKNVVLAAQAGVVGHIELGDGVKAAAKAGIHRSVKANEVVVGGFPAMAYEEWFKTYGDIRRLSRLREALKRLDEKVCKIEEVLRGDDGRC